MEVKDILREIEEAEVNWTVADFKAAIFADDLRGCAIYETITECTYYNFSMIKDALNRTGSTIADLEREAHRFQSQWPESYSGEDFEWAIWDAADDFVMEVLGRDSRICKRAGW